MDGKQGTEIRDSITKAIGNFISYNEKGYPYDKTYLGRIILVNSDGTYDIQINSAKYQNIRSENGSVFFKNDIVKCIAPQNNLNLLYISSGARDQEDVDKNALGVKNFINGIKLNGLQINGVEASNLDLNTIVQAGFYGIANGTNTPPGTGAAYGELIVFGYRTLNNWLAQLYIVQGDDPLQANYMYLRSATSSGGASWSNWKLISFADASNAVAQNWIDLLLTGNIGYGDKIVDKNISQNGYIKYASGLFIQWGESMSTSQFTTINILSYTSESSYVALATWRYPTLISRATYAPVIQAKTANSFVVNHDNAGAQLQGQNWITIGY